MDLHRGLRCQPHTRAATDADELLKVIVPEYARGRRGEDHVQAVCLGKPSSHPERRLGIGLAQHGATVAVDENEFQPRVPPDDCG
jgi:hypothetical protein